MKKITYILILIFWTNLVQSQELLRSGDSLVKSGSSVVKVWTPNELNPDFAWSGGVNGSNLIDISGNGVIIPIISGSVVNGMIDSSVILDMENLGGVWDKQRYVGNGFGKPETWDFPYYYYDVSNPYHWKAWELGYRYIEDQCLLDSNFCFARYRYDLGVKLDRLFIFSTPQNTDLAQIKKYIWIVNDFRIDPEKGFDFIDDNWLITGSVTLIDNNSFTKSTSSGLVYKELFTANDFGKPLVLCVAWTGGNMTIRGSSPTTTFDGGTFVDKPAGSYELSVNVSVTDNLIFQTISSGTFNFTLKNIVYEYINYYRHESPYN